MNDTKKLRLVRHQYKATRLDNKAVSQNIQMFAKVIGLTEALKISAFAAICKKRLDLYFPRVPANHILSGVISDDALQALCDEFAGMHFHLGRQKAENKGMARQRIARALQNGLKAKDIAEMEGVHVSTVYREMNKRVRPLVIESRVKYN